MAGREQNGENHAPGGQGNIFNFHVQLPTGERASFEADKTSTVRDLKMLVEINSGVPSDLFTLAHNAINVKEETKIVELGIEGNAGSVVLDVEIPLWWQRFIDRCMRRDKRQIIKRIAIKMNQISSEERAFVAAFIAAQKGDGELFQCLINGDVKIDVEQKVKCSGRTLLHAVVIGGNFSCAVTLFINKGWTLLNITDAQGLTPLETAKKLNKQGFTDLLKKYIELKDQEDQDVSEDSSDIIRGESSDGRVKAERDSEDDVIHSEQKKDLLVKTESPDQLIKSKECEDHTKRVPIDLTQMKEINGKENSNVPSQRIPNHSTPVKQPVHKPLRNCRSLGTDIRPTSARSRLVCVEEIISLGGKTRTKSSEDKLPRISTPVGTPTSSPIASPRVGRKLVPSSLNTEIIGENPPGSLILRPRSPSLPRSRSPCLSRSRSPSSPLPRRQASPFPAGSEAIPQRARATSIPGGESRKMSREMHDFLMLHYDSREDKPWNAWRMVKKNQLAQFDVSDDDDSSSSDDENVRLQRFLQSSNRRKTFEIWLTDKEAEIVKKQTLLAEKAKKEAESKEKEARQRYKTRKTFEEWIQEKEYFKNEADSNNTGKAADNEQTEARKAEVVRKYQEWLRAKDEEALAKEDRLRKELAAKFSETKQKRDEKMKVAWFTRKNR